MLPVYIVFQAMGAAAQIQLANERKRIAAGLPPLPPPPEKTEAEKAKERRDDRVAGTFLVLYLVFSALIFVSIPTMFLYILFKILFARQGLQFP